MSRFSEVIIIGAGAGGLMCAANLKKEYIVLEGSSKAANKLLVAGGGRCNFTNEEISPEFFVGDRSFASYALDSFSYKDMRDLSEKWQVPFEVRKNRQLFCKNSSKELVSALLAHVEKGAIETNAKVSKVSFEEGLFRVESEKGVFCCKTLVVASGGLSYAPLGASEIGYEIAKTFGHEVVPVRPALVGFTLQPSEFWFKELSGVSVESVVKVGGKSFKGGVLFAHRGVSGPAILNASLYWERGFIEINFLPEFDIAGSLGASVKQITSVLPLPKSFTKAFLASQKMEDKPVNKLLPAEREVVCQLNSYKFAPSGTFGYQKAEITKGGVSTNDIDPFTMESKLKKNLYFIGETLNISGELGGYNIHWAFASAAIAGKSIDKA